MQAKITDTPQKEASGGTVETKAQRLPDPRPYLEKYMDQQLRDGFDRAINNMFDEDGFLK